ncbi:MAG: methyl-accepting chemotaxis protein [Bacillota bacterium]|jgi:methyl-accepting chemotaxis protein
MKGFQLKSIKTQITVAVVLIVAVVCIGVALVGYWMASAGLRANMNDSIQTIVKQGADLVNERVDKYFSELNILAENGLFQDLQANQAEITALLNKVSKQKGYVSLLVADTGGNAYRMDGTTLQIGDRDYFRKALQGQNVVTDPIVSKSTGKMVIIFAAPLRDESNQVCGVLALTRNGDELSEIIADVTYGKSGKAFMINKQGTTVAHYDQAKVIDSENTIELAKKDLSLQPVAAVQQKMLEGSSGIAEYTYQGVDKYTAYCLVSGTEWSLALTTPKSEIFAAMYRMGTLIFMVSLLFLVIGGVISYFVARHTTVPIQNVINYISNVALGNLEHDVPVSYRARADEIGKLAEAAQNMTDDLREKAAAAHQIAQGDLNVRLTLKSEKDILTQNLNEMTDNLQKVIADINMLAKAAVAGNLEVRADAAKHLGDYQKMVGGINATLDAVITPVTDAEQILEKLALNDYTEEMPVDKYQGDLRHLAEKINDVRERLLSLLEVAISVSKGDTDWLAKLQKIGKRCANDQLMPAFIVMMQSIEDLIQEVDRLAQAAISGDLQTRGDAGGFKGGFARIVGGFNQALDAIIEPVNETSGVLQEMATGNLNVAVSGNYRGDHALLAQALNHTLDSFNEVLTDFNSAAGQVATGAQQVSDSSQVLSQSAAEQASTTEEITASMTEIATQTKQNAENAGQANQLALTAQEQATVGNSKMQQMLEAMTAINDSSASISKIIKVIDEIAFQTNILALNAAVEAARAGQYGKGFAVVAEEVRNLAARSANAAKETTDLIESSIQKVEGGSKIAHETAESLDRIVREIAKTTDLVGAIAGASNEQASGISQVNQGINQIAQVTQTNTATAEESAAASEELAGQAEMLKEMVQKFRLKDKGTHFGDAAEAGKRDVVKQLETKKPAGVTTAEKQLTESKEFGKY